MSTEYKIINSKTAIQSFYDKFFIDSLNIKISNINNNDTIMPQIIADVENIINNDKVEAGYILFGISLGKKRFVCCISSQRTHLSYFVNVIDSPIDVGVSYEVYETNTKISIEDIISELTNKHHCKYLISVEESYDIMLSKDLVGYCINPKKLEDIFSKYNVMVSAVESEIYKNFDMTPFDNTTNNIIKNVSIKDSQEIVQNSLLKMMSNAKLSVPVTINSSVENHLKISTKSGVSNIFISHIIDVININNVRKVFFKNINLTTKQVTYTVEHYRLGNKYSCTRKDDYIVYTDLNRYGSIPFNAIDYNYMDKGRTIVYFHSEDKYKQILVFEDPRIKQISNDFISEVINNEISEFNKNNIDISYANFIIDSKTLGKVSLSLNSYSEKRNTTDIKSCVKALKLLNDEYNYIIKKSSTSNEHDTEVIDITDNIRFNSKTGCVEYEDFIIGSDLQALSNSIKLKCDSYVLSYYNKQLTEQQIIDTLIDNFIAELDNISMYTKIEKEFNVIFSKVIFHIKLSSGGNKFCYINNNRVNRNEISQIIKEVSCFNDQTAANKYLDNICKKGLSVFIGLTSGYYSQKTNYYFKFKTTENKNEYVVNIKDFEFVIAGKKIFNLLYDLVNRGKENANKNRGDKPIEMIDKAIFNCVKSRFDYIKYKMLITDSAKEFIENSTKFLHKKIEDINAEKVNYIDTSGNQYDGIYLTGASGKKYLIAYNLKESFAFINPEEKNSNEYTGGKYLCMIDSSKTKSSIGYNTVISKMLALKNDSTIANTIYNLEDELNKGI